MIKNHELFFTEKQIKKILFQNDSEGEILEDFPALFDLSIIDLYGLSEMQKLQLLKKLSNLKTKANHETLYKKQAFLQNRTIQKQFLLLYLNKLSENKIQELGKLLKINDDPTNQDKQTIENKIYYTFFPVITPAQTIKQQTLNTQITPKQQKKEELPSLNPEIQKILEQEDLEKKTNNKRYQQEITEMTEEELLVHLQKLLFMRKMRERELFPIIDELDRKIEAHSQVLKYVINTKTLYKILKNQLTNLKERRALAINMFSIFLDSDQEYQKIQKELHYLNRVIKKRTKKNSNF